MSAYTMWYREGTASIEKNSYNLAGTSTYWLSAGIQAGDMFTVDGSNFYEISEVTDSSHIVLKTPYLGESLTSSKYAVIRNFNSGGSARVSALAAQLLGYFDKYIDSDMQSIHGKSAYEVAVQNGYTGTVDAWLESLKAAGEWSNASTRISTLEGDSAAHTAGIAALNSTAETLNARTNILTANTYEFHNSIAGFRDKGTVLTDEQKAAITNKTFDDLYIGDYWTINGHRYYIAKFHSLNGGKLMMLSNVLYNAQMNETDTNEGGHQNSWLFNAGLDMCQKIRDELGVPVRVNSGCRCRSHNAKVGGVPNSQHIQGYAADLSCSLGASKMYERDSEGHVCAWRIA